MQSGAFEGLLVVGPGSLGLGLAVTAARRGVTVAVHGRHGPLGRGALEVRDATLTAAFAAMPGPNWCAVVAAKSQDIPAAVATTRHALDHCAAVLVLRNGLGDLPDFGGRPAAEGVVWACADRLAAGRVRWRGPIAIDVPASWSAAGAVARLLGDALVAVRPAEDFRRVQFRKLMVNAGVNPLTAIHGVDCRGLAASPGAVAQAVAVAAEVAALAAASGVPVDEEPGALVEAALAGMNDFIPSMAQDRAAARSLEIGSILDGPLALAERLGVEMPVLAGLRRDLETLDRNAATVGTVVMHIGKDNGTW